MIEIHSADFDQPIYFLDLEQLSVHGHYTIVLRRDSTIDKPPVIVFTGPLTDAPLPDIVDERMNPVGDIIKQDWRVPPGQGPLGAMPTGPQAHMAGLMGGMPMQMPMQMPMGMGAGMTPGMAPGMAPGMGMGMMGMGMGGVPMNSNMAVPMTMPMPMQNHPMGFPQYQQAQPPHLQPQQPMMYPYHNTGAAPPHGMPDHSFYPPQQAYPGPRYANEPHPPARHHSDGPRSREYANRDMEGYDSDPYHPPGRHEGQHRPAFRRRASDPLFSEYPSRPPRFMPSPPVRGRRSPVYNDYRDSDYERRYTLPRRPAERYV